MTLPLARDLSSYGIRVNTIAPGIMETPMIGGMTEEVKESLAQVHVFPKRLGRPAEFAALAQHLFENTLINGETIRLDAAARMGPPIGTRRQAPGAREPCNRRPRSPRGWRRRVGCRDPLPLARCARLGTPPQGENKNEPDRVSSRLWGRTRMNQTELDSGENKDEPDRTRFWGRTRMNQTGAASGENKDEPDRARFGGEQG